MFWPGRSKIVRLTSLAVGAAISAREAGLAVAVKGLLLTLSGTWPEQGLIWLLAGMDLLCN